MYLAMRSRLTPFGRLLLVSRYMYHDLDFGLILNDLPSAVFVLISSIIISSLILNQMICIQSIGKHDETYADLPLYLVLRRFECCPSYHTISTIRLVLLC